MYVCVCVYIYMYIYIYIYIIFCDMNTGAPRPPKPQTLPTGQDATISAAGTVDAKVNEMNESLSLLPELKVWSDFRGWGSGLRV